MGSIEVKSFQRLLESLDLLKLDVSWRRSLIAQGQVRAQDFTPEKIVRKWQVFLEVLAIPAYVEWCSYSPRQQQQALIAVRSASYLSQLTRRSRQWLTALSG